MRSRRTSFQKFYIKPFQKAAHTTWRGRTSFQKKSLPKSRLVRLTGFELATSTSAGWRSIQLSYSLKKIALRLGKRKRQESNLPSPNGTDGLAIRCITALPRFQNTEREGFEPPEPAKVQRFSRPPRSTTLPSLQMCFEIISYFSSFCQVP